MKATALLRRHVSHVEILEARIAPAAFHWNVNANGNWNDENNWFNETTSQAADGFPNAASDTAKFLGVITADRVITIPIGTTVTAGFLVFNDDNNYTISGGFNSVLSVNVSSGEALISTGGLGNATIAATVRLNDLVQLSVGGPGVFSVDGVLTEAGGAQSINKTGTGTLSFTTSGLLNEDNTYTGTTTVSEGTLQLNKRGVAVPGALIIGDGTNVDTVQFLRANQIGNASDVTVNRSGVLALGTLNDTVGTLALQTGTSSGAQVTGTTGTLTLTDNVVVTQNGSGAVGATISANLALGATRTFTVPNGSATADLTLSGAIFGAGVGLTTAGVGTLRLSGAAANTYDGLTTVGVGSTLELGKTVGVAASAGTYLVTGVLKLLAADQIDDTQTLTIGSGANAGNLQLNNFNETFASLNLAVGSVTTGTGTLTLAGDVTTTASGATISGLLALPAGAHLFTVADGAGATDLSITAAVSGAGAFTKAGAGTLDFGGTVANSYAGTTTILDGTVNALRDTGVIAVPGAIVIGDGTGAAGSARLFLNIPSEIAAAPAVTIKAEGLLELDLGGTFSIGTLTLESGTASGAQVKDSANVGTPTLILGGDVVVNSTGTGATGATIVGPTLNLGAATRTFTIADGAAANDLSITSALAGGAGIGLTKAGTGTLQLAATVANTYLGTTAVLDGNLALAGTNTKVPGPLIIGDGAGAGGTARVTLNAAGMLPATNPLTIKMDGLLDLTNRNATVTTLTVESGTASGGQTSGTGILTTTGDVTFNTTGTGVTGANLAAPLTLGGNVTLNPLATSSTVTISGQLDLGGATRTFTLGNGGAAIDLDISGKVLNGGISKTGAGVLRLSGAVSNGLNPLNVLDGDVVLAKTGATQAVSGALTIGDGTGAAASARVILAGNGQINGFGVTTVKSEGLLDLAGFNQTLNNLTVESGDTSGAQITTGAGALTLNTAAPVFNLTGAGTIGVVISGNLVLPSTVTFTIPDGAAAVDLDLAAAISTNGNAGLTKAGAGTLRLSGAGANTYFGTTTLNDGTLLLAKTAGVAAFAGALNIGDGTGATGSARLALGASNQLPDIAALLLAPDAQLDLGAFDDTVSTLTLQSGTTAGAQVVSTTGRLTLAQVGGNGLTFDIAGTGATAATINGNVTLAGSLLVNTSATSATVSIAGQLDLGANVRTFTVNDGAASAPELDISAVVSGGLDLFKNGAGTLRFSGAQANSFTGLIVAATGLVELGKSANIAASAGGFQAGQGVNTGTLRLLAAGQIGDTQPVTVDGAGTLDLNGFSETIGALALNGIFNVAPTLNTGAGTLTLGGNVTSSVNNVAPTITGNLNLAGASRTFTTFAGVNQLGLTISAAISGAAGSALVKAGTGTLLLSGAAANSYVGSTTVANGVIELGKTAGVVAVPGAIVIGDGTGNSISAALRPLAAGQFADGTSITIKNDGLLDLNGFDFTSGTLALESGDAAGSSITTGAGTLTLGGDLAFSVSGTGAVNATIDGKLSLGAANRTFAVADGTAQTDLVINATISGAAGVGLTKSGAGTLQFFSSVANSYTGPTVVADGELGLGFTIGVPGLLTVGDGTGASGSAGVSNANASTLPAGLVLNVKTDGLITFNGNLTTGALTLESGTTAGAQIVSNSTLTLGGDVTLVSTGTGATGASIAAALNLGAADRSFTIANGAAAADLTVASNIAGAAGSDLTKLGAGTLRFTAGAFSYAGDTAIADGTLLVESQFFTSPITIGDGTGAAASAIFRTVGNLLLGAQAVTVKTDGLLDLNGTSQNVGLLTLESGTTSAAQVTMGVGTLGVFGGVALVSTGTGATGANLAGKVDFGGGNQSFTIADGAAAVDLDLTATIANANFSALFKTGAGTLRLGGTGANALGDLTVQDGAVTLNKPVGGTAFTNLLTIGDGTGAAGSARVTSAANEQIPDTANVVIAADGLLDLNGATETLGAGLTLQSGTTSGAGLTTGAGTLVLGVNANVLNSVTGTGAVGAIITGALDLGGTAHQFSAANGAAAADLEIAATIIGGAGSEFQLTTVGAGVVRLSGATANTFNGPVTVRTGTLELGKITGLPVGSPTAIAVPGALAIGTQGTGSVRLIAPNQIADAGAITVLDSGTLDLNGFNESVGPLNLQSAGQVTTGAGTLTLTTNLIASGGGSPTISGQLSLGASTRTFTTTDFSLLVVEATISGGAGTGINVGGNGTTRFAGAGSNTFSGTVTVTESLLELAKTGGAQAIPDALVIGDGGGGVATVGVAGVNQLAPAGTVTVRTDGTLSAVQSQALGSLILENGDGVAASVTGTLALGGNVTVVKVGTGSTGVSFSASVDLAVGNHTFTVADGAAAADLRLTGLLLGAGSFTKTGAGTAVFQGNGSNSYGGTTTVADGVLDLQQGGIAVPGAVIIGDGTGAGSSAILAISSGGNFNPANSAFTIRTDGLLQINSGETITTLTLESGTTAGGRIEGFPFALNGTVTVVATGTGASPARIAAAQVSFDAPVTFTVADGAAAADLEITAALFGGINMTKDGPGALLIPNGSGYTGNVQVNAGTLLVDSFNLNSNVTLANGARLGGNGGVKSVALDPSGGKIAPGRSPGVFIVRDALTFNASSTLELEVNGTIAGTDFDVLASGQLNDNQSLNLGGATLQLAPNFVPTPGSIFLVIDNRSTDGSSIPSPIVGTFAGLAEGASVQTAGGNYAISYVGGDGNDVILTPQFIAPTIAAGNKTATFKDVDGDLVTVAVTKGNLAAGQFLIIAAGGAGGGQLARLNLSNPADLFATTNLTISAAKKPGGDGFVNVGAVAAAGINLGTVTIKGDLGQIDAGNGNALIPAIASLLPNSLGVKGITTQAGGGSLSSDIVGALKNLKTTGDVKNATVNVTGTLGPVSIGGALNNGVITATGNIGNVAILKGASGTSGAGGSIQAGGTLGNVAITGNFTTALGAGAGSGSLIAAGAMGAVTIKGDFLNEAGVGAGRISAGGKLGAVNVTGLAKGVAIQTTGDIAGITIGKDLAANTAGFASSILGGGKLTALTVKGSILGGAIRIADDLGSLTVTKDIIGTAAAPVIISAEGKLVPAATSDLAIGKLTVNGDFTNVRVLAGFDTAGNATNADASIGPVVIGKNWTASSLIAGARNLGADQLPGGSGANADNVNFGDGNDFLIPLSDDAKQTAKIASIIIKGTAAGSATAGDHFGIVAQEVTALKIGSITSVLKPAIKENLALGSTGNFRLREV